jgi:GAF domain
VNAEQSKRIAVAFARAVTKSPPAGLCDACVEVLAVSGAGITVMGGGQSGQLCVSSQRMAALEDLQFTMGIGPCQDAFHSGQPVHAPSLGAGAVSRWPAFVDMARDAGIGSVFAYPLASNGAKIGVMTLYQDVEGELTADQHDDSIAMAAVLTETVLSLQDAAPEGVLAEGLQEVVAYRAEVHQASGMVSIQLKIPVAEALVRVRAYAFAHDQPVGVVAAEIVARRLRIADDRGQPGEGV